METPRPYSTAVDPAWLDYNNHVTDAAYAVVAAAANEALEVDMGMSEGHRRRTGRAFYTAQLTIRYLTEIAADSRIVVLRTITRLGAKSMTVATEFHVDDHVAATTEHVYVLIDSAAGGGSSPLSDEERARIEPWVGKPL